MDFDTSYNTNQLQRVILRCPISPSRRNALSKFAMPAMSPTMTKGGIAQWKVKEGQKYSTGDVLLKFVRIPFTILFRVVPLTFHTRKQTKLPSM